MTCPDPGAYLRQWKEAAAHVLFDPKLLQLYAVTDRQWTGLTNP